MLIFCCALAKQCRAKAVDIFIITPINNIWGSGNYSNSRSNSGSKVGSKNKTLLFALLPFIDGNIFNWPDTLYGVNKIV